MTRSDFRGATAIVTGGASGIGLALARELVAAGARVVLADVQMARAEEEAARLRAGGAEATAAAVDVRDAEAVERLVASTVERWGRLDLLFNNAGVVYVGDVLDMADDAWRTMIDVNVWGVVNGVRAAYPRMVTQRAGHIVNTASVAGLGPAPGFTIYSLTKHAVVGLSRSLRVEARRHGVGVTALCPGFVRTPMIETATYVRLDAAGAKADIGGGAPFATPERVARDALRGVRRNRAVVVTPTSARVVERLVRLWPAVGEWGGAEVLRRVARFRQPATSEASVEVGERLARGAQAAHVRGLDRGRDRA